MKYATWSLYFPDSGSDGYAIDKKFIDAGGSLIDSIPVTPDCKNNVCVFNGNVDFSLLQEWNFQEINRDTALEIISSWNSTCSISDTGNILYERLPSIEVS